MSNYIPRKHSGQPDGGQFTTRYHDPSDVTLTMEDPGIDWDAPVPAFQLEADHDAALVENAERAAAAAQAAEEARVRALVDKELDGFDKISFDPAVKAAEQTGGKLGGLVNGWFNRH